MLGALVLSTGLGLAADVPAPEAADPHPGRRRGLHASITRPEQAGAPAGYDLGVSSRGKYLQLDVDLGRRVLSHDAAFDGDDQLHLGARRTARVATGVVVDGDNGDTHRLLLRVDRQSWLGLATGFGSAWSHELSQSLGLAGVYGWSSRPDQPVRTSLHIGGGIRRAASVSSAWDGSLFDRSASSMPQSSTDRGVFAQAQSVNTGSRGADLDLDLDLGRHRARRDRGLTLTSGVQVDVPLWADHIDGRVDTSIELDQFEAATWSWGPGAETAQRRWTALTTRTRLAARLVGLSATVVPTLFVDVNTLRVVEAPATGGVVPLVGLGLSSGGS